MTDWRDDRVGSAHRGENPMVMARMRSGFAVIGDTQHLPGYSLLLCGERSANHLTDLDLPARTDFLLDLALLGEAVESVAGGTVCAASTTRSSETRRRGFTAMSTPAMTGSPASGRWHPCGATRQGSETTRGPPTATSATAHFVSPSPRSSSA